MLGTGSGARRLQVSVGVEERDILLVEERDVEASGKVRAGE